MNLYGARVETPVDDRGLVDHRELVAHAIETAEPADFETREDTHHVYWLMKREIKRNHDEDLARTYRELPINKILMPRGLHEIIHETTKPPALPNNEVMAYRIEAWNVAKSLFQTISEMQYQTKMVKHWSRQKKFGLLGPETDDKVGWDWLESQREANFRGSALLRRKHERIPEQLRLDEDFGRQVLRRVYEIRQQGSESNAHASGRLNLAMLGVELETVEPQPALAG